MVGSTLQLHSLTQIRCSCWQLRILLIRVRVVLVAGRHQVERVVHGHLLHALDPPEPVLVADNQISFRIYLHTLVLDPLLIHIATDPICSITLVK